MERLTLKTSGDWDFWRPEEQIQSCSPVLPDQDLFGTGYFPQELHLNTDALVIPVSTEMSSEISPKLCSTLHLLKSEIVFMCSKHEKKKRKNSSKVGILSHGIHPSLVQIRDILRTHIQTKKRFWIFQTVHLKYNSNGMIWHALLWKWHTCCIILKIYQHLA